MKTKKLLAGLLTVSMALTCHTSAVALNSFAVDLDVSLELPYEPKSEASSDIEVAYRTQDQIREYFSKHPFDLMQQSIYSSEPSAKAPYAAGKLDSKTLNNTLNVLNCMRYTAGLQEVSLNSSYNKKTQAAALVNCANNTLTHFPSKPSGMSDELYNLGASGCSSSNIFYGYPYGLPYSVIAYMDDSDSYNIDRLGHRRWCLNPSMKETGFGHVGSYAAMYAFDTSRYDATQRNVCWPAQNMPLEYFSPYSAWSISTDSWLDESEIKVTLRNTINGDTWKFSSSSSDGDFYVDNGGYGQTGCIIFRPNNISRYANGDTFDVTIEGAGDTIKYSVEFFTIKVNSHLGDVNLDDLVDSSDASLILVEYAKTSTGGKSSLSAKQKKNADTNFDGSIDSSDASKVLEYYSYISTGGTIYDMKDWV